MRQWAALNFTTLQNLKHTLTPFLIRLKSGYLALLFILAITLTIFVAEGDAVADRLFQSPVSPPAQPPPPAAEQPPTEPPAAEQPPAEPPAAEQPPAQPSAAPAESAPESEAPVPEPLPEDNGTPPFVQPPVEARSDTFEEPDRLSEEDEETSSSNFILDRVELVDSIVVSGAYIWLCCGAALLLLIPLLFIFLQVRGQIKIQREEDR